MAYYKVLKDNASCHGGTHEWSLPVMGEDGTITPGGWTPTITYPVICERGWHLTTKPMQWPVVGMAIYEAEPAAIHGTREDKIVTNRCRLLRPAPEMIPDWWHGVERFVTEEIPATPFFKPDGNPDPGWRLFTAPTLAAACDAARAAARAAAGAAARAAAWAAAGDAAGDAAWAAALYVITEHVCKELPLAETHRAHARARWHVWQKGYCLLCDVAGVLYVYAKDGEA